MNARFGWAITTAAVLILAACASGCRQNLRDTGAATVQASPPDPSAAAAVTALPPQPTPISEPLAPVTPVALPTPTMDIRQAADGELLITTVTVPRHGIDLPAFHSASADELRRDERIRITGLAVDDGLRAEGIPVSVINFEASTVSESETTASVQLAGRQYAVALADEEHFLVVTCLGAEDDITGCNDEFVRIELPLR